MPTGTVHTLAKLYGELVTPYAAYVGRGAIIRKFSVGAAPLILWLSLWSTALRVISRKVVHIVLYRATT